MRSTWGRAAPTSRNAVGNRRRTVDAAMIDTSLRRTVEKRILALEQFERFRDSLHDARERTRDALR